MKLHMNMDGTSWNRWQRRTKLVHFESNAGCPEALETFMGQRQLYKIANKIAKYYDMVTALNGIFGLFLLKYYADIQSLSKKPGVRNKQPEGELKVKKENLSRKKL